MSWYLEVLKKYAVFNGRARRKEYWFFFLFSIVISIVLTIIDVGIGSFSAEAGIGALSGIFDHGRIHDGEILAEHDLVRREIGVAGPTGNRETQPVD